MYELEGKLYKISDTISEASNTAIVEIIDGEFTGVKFSYGSITCGDENEDGSMNLIFDYQIHETPEEFKYDVDDIPPEPFEILRKNMGDIIVDILTGYVEYENRNGNSSPSTV